MHAKVYFAGWSTFYTGGPNSIIATDGSIVYERFVPHGQNKFDRSIFLCDRPRSYGHACTIDFWYVSRWTNLVSRSQTLNLAPKTERAEVWVWLRETKTKRCWKGSHFSNERGILN